MPIQSQNKLLSNPDLTEKFEVVKHRKYCKPRSIKNEPIKCQNSNVTLHTDDNSRETENSSDSYTLAHRKKDLTIRQSKFDQ